MSNVKDENNRLTRWSLALQPYHFEIEHRKGWANANAGTNSQVNYLNECCAQEKVEENVIEQSENVRIDHMAMEDSGTLINVI